jgi:3-oxoacyl-[acyl-carrier protein] reductase
MESGGLTGQVAVITGCGSESGIGFAVARALGNAGAAVVIGSTTARIADRVATLGAEGVDAVGVVGDLTDPAAARALVDAAMQRHGRVDKLVNNAGMVSQASGWDADGLVEQLDPADWTAGLARNLTTAFLMTAAVVPLMRAAGYGRIVNVSSTTGPVAAMPGQSLYSAAKAGLVGLTRAVALEVALAGITVNAVAPGWIDTGSATDAERSAGRATPLGRSGRADEVAALVRALCDPQLSYVTGQLVVVDGGNSVIEDKSAPL